jgi:two-component sensor histidine kinase
MERLDVEAALQASEASSRIVLDSLTAHIAVLDVTGTVVAVNEAWKQFARENNADESRVHVGTNYLTVCRSASTSREDKIALQAFDGIQSVIQGAQNTFSMEYPCNSSIEQRWFRLVVRPLGGGGTGVVVAHENITERRQALNDLQQSLEEKTVLLKEVHHRVKNNLQVVSSLLHMEESQGVDKTKVNVLQEAQNRLRSMALIHETLYRSQNFARIDYNTYIESLCVHITRSFGTGTSKARLERRMQSVKFVLDQAVPCGLIINELISNAMKHGFPDERPGRILLELKLEGQQVRLRVADDGIGLPPGLDMQKSPTLGMRLVWMLSRQLHGSVQIEAGPGTSILVTFPLQVE